MHFFFFVVFVGTRRLIAFKFSFCIILFLICVWNKIINRFLLDQFYFFLKEKCGSKRRNWLSNGGCCLSDNFKERKKIFKTQITRNKFDDINNKLTRRLRCHLSKVFAKLFFGLLLFPPPLLAFSSLPSLVSTNFLFIAYERK